MENPETWGKAEYVVRDAIQAAENRPVGFCGLSKVRMITDALREAGLLDLEVEVVQTLGAPTTCIVKRDDRVIFDGLSRDALVRTYRLEGGMG